MRFRVPVPVAYLLSVMLFIAACSDGDDPSPTATSVPPEEPTAAVTAEPQPQSFTGSDGETLTLEEPPERVVSLAAHATEIFCAIGAGDQLVAVEQFANCPADSDEKPAVDAFQPSVEAIVAYDPDLVYAWYDPGDLVQSLRTAGVPVFFLAVPEDIQGLFDNITLIGEITGREDEAESLIADMEAERDAIVASIDDIDAGPRIFHEIDPTLYTARSDTFVGELYALLKAENIADEAESQFPQLSSEAVVAADPEVIILADFADPEGVAARPGWSAISAIENDRICEINPDLTDRPGPNIMQGLGSLADCLYPDR